MPIGEFLANFLDATNPKTTCTIQFIPSRFDDDIDIWLSNMHRSYLWGEQVEKIACLTTFTKVVFDWDLLRPKQWF